MIRRVNIKDEIITNLMQTVEEQRLIISDLRARLIGDNPHESLRYSNALINGVEVTLSDYDYRKVCNKAMQETDNEDEKESVKILSKVRRVRIHKDKPKKKKKSPTEYFNKKMKKFKSKKVGKK